jgi:hypothetical protein
VADAAREPSALDVSIEGAAPMADDTTQVRRLQATASRLYLQGGAVTLDAWLKSQPGRCPDGFDLVTQHPGLCKCTDEPEWLIFTAALRQAARGGEVHQRNMRPLLRGRIKPQQIGQQYKRAIREGLIAEIGREESNDQIGRNTNKWEPVYELRSAA